MKIKSLAFENYKAFAKNQIMSLKPITILIGKNSSGKSALAKLFTLLENSLSGRIEEPLLLVNNHVELGGQFLDLVYNQQPSVPIKFSIEFENGVVLAVSIVQDSSEYRLTVFEWEYRFEQEIFYIKYSPENGYSDKEGNIFQCKFCGIIPIEMINSDQINIIDQFFLSLSIDVDYIGPFRVLPERQFHLTGRLKFENTGSKGENAYPILGVSKLLKQQLHEQVGAWYEKYFNGWKLEVDDKNRPFIEIKLVKKDSAVNIVDVGQGMNQALPLVVRAYIPRSNSLVIIEQPELHLHPAAHGDMGELFARSAINYNQNFIIETHSENIILRLRKLVIENDFGLTFNDVIIYWINDSIDPQELIEITIDNEGVLTDWPSGVFNENLLEIHEMRKAVLRKKNNA